MARTAFWGKSLSSVFLGKDYGEVCQHPALDSPRPSLGQRPMADLVYLNEKIAFKPCRLICHD
ncbi:hypothetical protein EK904_005110 [Melospiza melodia maxima]|nr:hypothetical protein EK904_005110 [Melospiza melodia maxima]